MHTSLRVIFLCCIVLCSGNNAGADLQEEGSSNSRMLGCGSGEVPLSNNRTLAPLNMVQASRSLNSIGARATRIYDSITTWCTNDDDPDPYIDMQFTSPILVTMMISTGSTFINPAGSLGIYYISNFTLEHSPPDNSSMLNYYNTSTEDSATPEYFIVQNFTTLIQFKRPFITQRIRLRPVDWFDSDGNAFPVQYLCQGVALYGCLQSQVREVSVNENNQALSIVLPITLIVIAALVVLVGVLVYLLVRKQKAKKDVHPDSGYSFLERSQQPLSEEHGFTATDVQGSRHETRQSSIIKKVDNPIYGKDRQGSVDGQSHAYSTVSEPGYEPVNSNEPPAQTTIAEGQLRYLEYGNNPAKDGLYAIPEVNTDNVRVVVNTSYEPVGMGEPQSSSGSNSLHLEGTAQRADSMVDNRAYNRESYDGCVSRMNDGKEGEKEGEGGGGGGGEEYEAIVALQSNSSYNYVTTLPLPSPTSED